MHISHVIMREKGQNKHLTPCDKGNYSGGMRRSVVHVDTALCSTLLLTSAAASGVKLKTNAAKKKTQKKFAKAHFLMQRSCLSYLCDVIIIWLPTSGEKAPHFAAARPQPASLVRSRTVSPPVTQPQHLSRLGNADTWRCYVDFGASAENCSISRERASAKAEPTKLRSTTKTSRRG